MIQEEPKGSGRQHPLARAGEVLLFWIPVLVPLVLLAQLGTRGLKPALENEKALEADELVLDELLLLTEKQRQDLERMIEAQPDPIFRSRNERRLIDKARAPQPTTEPGTAPVRKR